MTIKTKKAQGSIEQPAPILYQPIAQRIEQPSPTEIRVKRKTVGLTQAQATALVSAAQGKSSYRTWQGYEAGVDQHNHRAIPLASWELFLLLTNQHPSMVIKQKSTGNSGD